MRVISSFLTCGRRQLHTIVSREIIKPSSPTPSNLKTYNLSSTDQFAPDAYIPMVIFYPNSNNNFHVNMKNSLSQTLTHYYPFAGRLATTTPSFVDCNDEGVEFLEAQNDKELSDFLHNMQHEDLDQLSPNGLVWKKLRSCSFENDTASPLAVQVNQFACGGLAVAASLSHKLADGSSLCNFFNDWAIMTRLRSTDGSPIDPQFMPSKKTKLNFQGLSLDKSRDSSVTKSFVFAGSKLNELKLKVITMTAESEQPIMNPTRIEVLNWLLYKCALKAATHNNLGSFKPTGFILVTNIRNKMIEPLPKTTIGNFFKLPSFPTKDLSEITLSTFVGQLKNLKVEVQGLNAAEIPPHMSLQAILEEQQRELDDYYGCTSFCRYPFYEVDFGWGKPIKAAIPGTLKNNSFFAMDAPDGDGIEVFVSLGKEDMEIFERDPELLSFC
ncbi:putative deacetylvindoline O-acetyltransferase [Helianthus annuus]|nr:putative deacetylvindoline O-acetyltransferase [Helianthus annuus]